MTDYSRLVEEAEKMLTGIDAPWLLDTDNGKPVIHEAHHYDSADEWYDVDGTNGGWLAHCEDLPTAEFVAAAPTLISALASALKEAQRELSENIGVMNALRRRRDEAVANSEYLLDILEALRDGCVGVPCQTHEFGDK